MPGFSGRFTISDNIKVHLQIPEIETPTVYDLELKMEGIDDIQLTHNNINSGSETVKIKTTETPTVVTKTLTGSTPVIIAPNLVKGSIICASDAAMTVVYVENEDFVTDYTAGTIERASTGSLITSGSIVYVWYIPFEVLIKDIDYAIDYDAGTIRRIAGTSIPDGATCFIDFAHSLGTVTDELVKLAISEANVFLQERMIDTNIDTVGSGIETVATYLALGIICNSSALRELNLRNDYSYRLAEKWQEMSERYFALAQDAFRKFENSSHPFTAGGAVKNRLADGSKKVKTSPSIAPGKRAF